MSTPTPRTDAASALTSQHRHDDLFGDPEFGWVTAGFARTLERELAAERARLDWVFRNCKVTADDYTTGHRDVYAIHDREDLGAAMKEGAK